MGILSELTKAEPPQPESGLIFTYKSESNPNVSYHTTVSEDGEPVHCTCPGWFHHRKCWHMTEALKHANRA